MIARSSPVSTGRRARAVFFSALLLFLAYAAAVPATTVKRVTIDEMLAKAELIFEGRVVEHEVKQAANGNIYTYIHFSINEIIKGDYSEPTLTLRFTGGTAGGLTLSVGDMHMPEVSEKGIYFVESLTGRYANPLLGWSQGHFLLIEDDDGIERVYTSQYQAVTTVEESYQRSSGISDGVAEGIATEAKTEAVNGMTRSRFVEALRERLGSSP